MATIKLSDGMWQSATAVVKFAKEAGLNVALTDVYTKENIKEIALIASFMKQLASKVAKCDIEVLNDK